MLRFGATCPSKSRRNATSRYLAPAAAPRRIDEVAIELELELEQHTSKVGVSFDEIVSKPSQDENGDEDKKGHLNSDPHGLVKSDAMEASSIACNEDPNKSRRATRKAAAACLARQRHKSFVNGLQDQGSVLRGRIESLRRRRGHAVSAHPCAVARALDDRIRTICCARCWTTVRPNPYTPCAHHAVRWRSRLRRSQPRQPT